MSNNIFTDKYIQSGIVCDLMLKLYPYFYYSCYEYGFDDLHIDHDLKFRNMSHIVTIASKTSKK
jgi:hypothetical protein